ncbi:hypothetical protein CCACVL1_25467 [Corchorus capsularis]|uniref:Uncharacterized protein n=1 Tax=Corchorus capsularis TaxID=210143 RepID=A0A1R3GJY3_COCAP|nr:hypothetical protein CCACVL1_25467 [Corchorus capsularis]
MALEMNGLGDTNQANVGISQAERDWIAAMELKINQPPKLLNESAGKRACCIFKVPQSLVGINENAYRPDIVSIGPYYRHEQHLAMIQEHKWRFLRNIHVRGVRLNDLYRAINSKEEEIRECYSATIEHGSNDLVEMMVLDGCFIIELFWNVHELKHRRRDELDDPILKMASVVPLIARDLLKLENQIPFFVLEKLIEPPILALGGNHPSMKNLTLGFFNYAVGRPNQMLQPHENLSCKHILDLFRLSMVPLPPSSPRLIPNNASFRLIPSAHKLRLAGVKFMPKQSSDSFLDIEFKNGVLQIPNLMLDDFATSLLLNCVTFEQCYDYCSNSVTCYATFMGCLINTPKDAEYLCDKKIIDNYLGANEQVACFFNNLGKDLPTDIHESYLKELFEDVNEYCSEGLRVCWAGFVNTYFRSRWSIISAIVGFLIVVSALVQAIFTLYPYVHSSPHKTRRKRLY